MSNGIFSASIAASCGFGTSKAIVSPPFTLKLLLTAFPSAVTLLSFRSFCKKERDRSGQASARNLSMRVPAASSGTRYLRHHPYSTPFRAFKRKKFQFLIRIEEEKQKDQRESRDHHTQLICHIKNQKSISKNPEIHRNFPQTVDHIASCATFEARNKLHISSRYRFPPASSKPPTTPPE